MAGGVAKQAKTIAFNPKLLEFVVCPLSKQLLRYSEKTQELISDSIGVAYPIVDGVACLIPLSGRILESNDGDKFSPKQT